MDDKRDDDAENNDLPDCLARWQRRDPSEDVDRSQDAFFVPADEIREAGYDLSLSTYKENVYEEEEYESPKVILARMQALNTQVGAELTELEEMLK